MVELLCKNFYARKRNFMFNTLVFPIQNFISKLICCVLFLFNLGGPTMPEQTLINHLFSCQEIVVYNNGTEIKLDKALIEPELKKLTDKSYFSPAFGVSLHDQTIEALKKGVWIEFRFNTERTYADMPFEKLLIELKPDYYGFNLIRFNNQKYEGRCFYLNLNVSSTKFYKFIVEHI